MSPDTKVSPANDTFNYSLDLEVRDELNTLQFILENDVLQQFIPTADAALSHLVRWFRIIANDNEKLCTFRKWVIPGSDTMEPGHDNTDCTSNSVPPRTLLPTTPLSSSPTSCPDSNKAPQIAKDAIVHDNAGCIKSSNGIIIPQPKLAHENSMGTPSTHNQHNVVSQPSQQTTQPPNQPTIKLSPTQGPSNTMLTVALQGAKWHAPSSSCHCTLCFTLDDRTINAARISGSVEGDLLFMVPQLNTPGSSTVNTPVRVRLNLCGLVSGVITTVACSQPFLYIVAPTILNTPTSDEDSEGTEGETDENGCSPPQALPPYDLATMPNSSAPSPKQMMTIRERMLDHVQRGLPSSVRLTLLQQPSVRVVWKNRRLDIPFKLRAESVDEPSSSNTYTPSKLVIIAVVADHKGRLQMDAAENTVEDFNTQGIAQFSNLRMTKGTWGKEWTIAFAVVVKASLNSSNNSTNNPVVVGVSVACPIVVKTRKNPQVRTKVESSPSPVMFERKQDVVVTTNHRAKRHRIEDILDRQSPSSSPSSSPSTSSLSSSSSLTSPPPRAPRTHCEDMASLLAAAEIKQHEQMYEADADDEPSSPSGSSLSSSASSVLASPSPSDRSLALSATTTANNHFGSDTEHQSFANLIGYLEDIRIKRQISLAMIGQPQNQDDVINKILVVKKGKPFRTPFQIELKCSALRHNPANYVCVAVVRNDKGEEVAVRNNEVHFDWRGVACFAGLMVMKGTWGKTVQLTFEAKWSSSKQTDKLSSSTGALSSPSSSPSWSKSAWSRSNNAHHVFTVAETTPIHLMCYTKDKKGSPTSENS